MIASQAAVYAKALRAELRLKGRVDLHRIAETLNLSVREKDLVGCDGALLRSMTGSKGIIVVRQSIREFGRKRFTIAHELGHLILEGGSAACISSDIGQWAETKHSEKNADEFAAELLIPSEEVQSLINSEKPSLQLIRRVAEQYETSLSASGWRFCDIVSVPCAIIWSTNGVIQWFRKSDSFAFFLRRGVAVPDASYAMAAHKGQEVPDEPEPLPAREWIEHSRILEGAEIWEQSVRLPWYDSALTLLWARREIIKEEREEDSLLPELDPEEFTLRRRRWPGKR
jgi:hypothetical protein